MRGIEWLQTDRGFDWPRIVLLGLGMSVIIAVTIGATVSAAPFNPYNPTWEGTADWHDGLQDDATVDVTAFDRATQYANDPGVHTVAFVIAPTARYGESDAVHLRSFVERGGTLVLMDDRAAASNALLEAIGASTRFDGGELQDPITNAGSPHLPNVRPVGDHAYGTGVETVTMNRPTVVEPNGATSVLNTSSTGYLGTPGDDVDEANLTTYTVATVEHIGAGSVVVVGDASVGINEMLAYSDNRRFLENIVDDADRVIFDQSHASNIPLFHWALMTVRSSATLQILLGVGVIGLVAAISLWGRDLWHRVADQESTVSVEADRADYAAWVRAEHPEWDDDTVDRVIGVLNRSDGKGGNNR